MAKTVREITNLKHVKQLLLVRLHISAGRFKPMAFEWVHCDGDVIV